MVERSMIVLWVVFSRWLCLSVVVFVGGGGLTRLVGLLVTFIKVVSYQTRSTGPPPSPFVLYDSG